MEVVEFPKKYTDDKGAVPVAVVFETVDELLVFYNMCNMSEEDYTNIHPSKDFPPPSNLEASVIHTQFWAILRDFMLDKFGHRTDGE